MESTLPSTHISRWVTSSRDISIEKIATGSCSRMPTCAATFSASDVLPIPGRAARITRFEDWKPAVIRSSSRKPVATPVISRPVSFSSVIRSNELFSSS